MQIWVRITSDKNGNQGYGQNGYTIMTEKWNGLMWDNGRWRQNRLHEVRTGD